MQPANGIIDKDEDGWIQATPKLFLPKAEEPTAVPPAHQSKIELASLAFFLEKPVPAYRFSSKGKGLYSVLSR